MSSRIEETVRRLTKLRDYIEANAHKAKTPAHKQDVLEDAQALDYAIEVLNDPRPRQQPLQDGWREDGR